MPDIKIHREHRLGLARARELAWQWAEEVESKFDMDCTVVEGEYSDTVEFTRSGVKGRLVVADDHFDLHAQLGFLLGAFSKTIENEIQKNLDGLLAGAVAQDAAAPLVKAARGAKAGAGKTVAKPADTAGTGVAAAVKTVAKTAARAAPKGDTKTVAPARRKAG